MKALVTGGAGYIGSFMVKRLLDEGHDVVVADSLKRGFQDMVDPRATLKVGDLLDETFVENVFSDSHFDVVMHFAGYIAVGESVESPGLYFRNNLVSTLNVLDQMVKHKVEDFIFSSTGTVYGTPKTSVLSEDHPKDPENPYAETKLMIEKMLHWYFVAHKIGYAVLRYFNASGAALDGSRGENHTIETHMIPNAMKAALTNTAFNLFGDDYNTPDGTAVRDYIHVLDLVEAHMLTLAKLQKEKGAYTYNVGTGKGSSNKEVIAMVQHISGVSFPVVNKPRREGDVAVTIADPSKIKNELGFVPKYSDLQTIISSAWNWHQNLSKKS